MRCFIILFLSVLSGMVLGDGQKIGEEVKREVSLIETLTERLPGYVASLPVPVDNTLQVPYRWVGYVRAIERVVETDEVFKTGDFTGCIFGHPNVILSVAHGFMDPAMKGYVFDFFWTPRYSEHKKDPTKLEAVKIRKVIVNNGSKGFAYVYRNRVSNFDFLEEDIACAIVYDSSITGDFARAYEPSKVVEAVTSTRSKLTAAYFLPDKMYGYTQIVDNKSAYLMRSSPIIKRPYERFEKYQRVYETKKTKWIDLQRVDADPTFIMTTGCSGAPIFIQDIDESWKIGLVHLAQSLAAGEGLEKQITAFLDDTKNHQSSFISTYAHILDQSFYDTIWSQVMEVLKDENYASEHVMMPQ